MTPLLKEHDEENKQEGTTSVWDKTHPPVSITMTSSTCERHIQQKNIFLPILWKWETHFCWAVKLPSKKVLWLVETVSYTILLILHFIPVAQNTDSYLILCNRKQRVSDISYLGFTECGIALKNARGGQWNGHSWFQELSAMVKHVCLVNIYIAKLWKSIKVEWKN